MPLTFLHIDTDLHDHAEDPLGLHHHGHGHGHPTGFVTPTKAGDGGGDQSSGIFLMLCVMN